MLKKCITLVLALMMVATMLGGCAPEAQTETPSETESATASEEAAPSSEASEEKLTFGVTVCMITGYYTAMVDAIQEKADEMGIEIVLLIAENDTTKQNQQMENLIAQQVDAIICNPEDGTAIAAAVTKAMDAGSLWLWSTGM